MKYQGRLSVLRTVQNYDYRALGTGRPLAQPPRGVFPCDWDRLRTEGGVMHFLPMGSPARSLVPVCQTPKTR
jgi:hypothetical protein